MSSGHDPYPGPDWGLLFAVIFCFGLFLWAIAR